MNDSLIRAGAVIDRCILDKEIEVGANARLGVGDDYTPNQLEPRNLNAGITLVGKRALVPPEAVVGRNCRIDPNVTHQDFEEREVPSGATVSPGSLLSERSGRRARKVA
jgi:glucose-1-phosphate adenylyltransferase